MRDDTITRALKRQLADAILQGVQGRNVTISAAVLDIDPSRLSDLRGGRIDRFSIEWLVRVLANIDRHVTLSIETRSHPEREWMRVLRDRKLRRQAEARGE